MAPSGGFFDKFFGSLVKDGLPILKSVLILLAKDISIPLELFTEKKQIDGRSYKNILKSGSGTTKFVNPIDELDVAIRIFKSLSDSNVLIAGVTKTVEK